VFVPHLQTGTEGATVKTLLLAVLAVGVLASPASATQGPQATVDDQVYCGQAAFARVYITREFHWDGRVKIYLGSYRHLRRAVTYDDVVNFSDDRGAIRVGELPEGPTRLLVTWHGRLLDRQRFTVDCT
jgi:hypothetical protein